MRVRNILQLVEPSLDHVRLPLTHLEASHPLQQPHLRRRAALLTPVWTRAQRTVRTQGGDSHPQAEQKFLELVFPSQPSEGTNLLDL